MSIIGSRMAPSVTVLVAMVACGPESGSEPTWATDVKPIFEANCLRCHGEPAVGGAPRGLRLDVLRDTALPDGSLVAGAGRTASESLAAVAARGGDSAAPAMPPGYESQQWQIETIERWCAPDDRGDCKPLQRGRRPDNHAPTLAMSRRSLDGTRLAFEYVLEDMDAEAVLGELLDPVACTNADEVGELPRRPLATLHTGRDVISVETAGLAEGTRRFAVTLDDGSEETFLSVDIPIVHEAGDAPPRAVFCAPAPRTRVDSVIEIVLLVVDEDTPSPLEVDVRAVEPITSATAVISQGLRVNAGTESAVLWDTSQLSDGTWFVEVEVTDGHSVRSWRSGPYFVDHRP